MSIQSQYLNKDICSIIDDYLHDNKQVLKQQLLYCVYYHYYNYGFFKDCYPSLQIYFKRAKPYWKKFDNYLYLEIMYNKKSIDIEEYQLLYI